ncbi:MAG: UvrD-helicase domain-containing protein [Candidatus Methylacidiphilaceae bacterium]
MRESPQIVRCCLIRASAGTGKTEELAGRIVELLRRGVDPHRIVAVTFTRKAAAEILDRVLVKLVEQAEADATGAGPVCDRFSRSALAALEGFLEDLPRLQLRTIDSLFQRIVRVCPFELGLPESFQLMDEFEARELRRSLLGQMLREGGEAAGRLAEAVGQVTRGEGGKSVWGALDELVSQFWEAYAEEPDPERWRREAFCQELFPGAEETDGERLWQEIAHWLSVHVPDRCDEWERLRPVLLAYRGDGAAHRLICNLLESYDPACGWCGEFHFQRKKIVPDARLARLLGGLVEFWLRKGLASACERTCGLASLLSGFHARYGRTLRSQGRIAFSDAPRLLRELGARGGGMDQELWLRIAFRLDSQWDHWLFDEFQDTSRTQWRALELLVGEVIQSAEGTRSFFCVGDAKQSIYGWRGGDRRLVEEIAFRYEGGLTLRTLSTSYRSHPAVIDLVNAVFGNSRALEDLYGKAGTAWGKDWGLHASAFTGAIGYSCYLEAGSDRGESRESEERGEDPGEGAEEEAASAVDSALARLVREIVRPAERGLSCAVLVQTNRSARRLADRLRKERVGSVYLEGEIFPGADNQAGRLVAAALQSLVHPEDTLVRGWLRASPLGDRFWGEWEKTGWRILHEKGFQGLVAEILARLPGPADDFAKERAGLLREMACQFDQGGSRDVERFLRFWKEQPVRLPEATGVIQVMTVHKAKGLGFDTVIVTELDRPVRMQCGLLDIEAPGGASRFLLAPAKPIADKIPLLAKAREKAREEQLFEQLCVLYVALTRARRELYVLAEARRSDGKGSSTPAHRDLLRRTLAGQEPRPLWEKGAVNVFFERGRREEFKKREEGFRGIESQEPLLFPPRSIRSMPLAPSRTAKERESAGAFSPARAAGLEFGTLVHELLAQVERADPASLESLRRMASSPASALFKEAAAAALGCVEWGAREAIFAPTGEVIIWREKSFEALLSGRWISGIFDRVHLFAAPGGSLSSAVLYDFKTDRKSGDGDEEGLLARYREQMELYREALAQMTSLPLGSVRVFLVWVGPRRLLEVSPPAAAS